MITRGTFSAATPASVSAFQNGKSMSALITLMVWASTNLEGRFADGAAGSGGIDDHDRQVGESLERQAGEVGGVAIAMPRRVDIRAGVPAEVEAGDVELSLVIVTLARGFVVHDHVDLWLRQAGIGLHAGDDLVAQLNKARHSSYRWASARNSRAALTRRWASFSS